jgi:hypothetical protein
MSTARISRTLRVWRITFPAPGGNPDRDRHRPGLTNHRLRDPRIPGGIRSCGEAGPR